MEIFRPAKGKGLIFLCLFTAIFDVAIFILIKLSNTYELSGALTLLMILFTIFALYYIIEDISLKYELTKEALVINRFWGIRKVTIPINEIRAFRLHDIKDGNVNGVRISGCFVKSVEFGKTMIDKMGTTYNFVTNNSRIIFINTDQMNYCISPKESNKFIDKISMYGIKSNEFTDVGLRSEKLYKEKKYIALIIVCAILLIFVPSIPIVLYLRGKLPALMPLSFDKNFIAVKYGTAKQFVFKQIIYGVLNMAVFFCFYFASYFYQKYDKKTAYTYIYIGALICISIMLFQLKILYTFIK